MTLRFLALAAAVFLATPAAARIRFVLPAPSEVLDASTVGVVFAAPPGRQARLVVRGITSRQVAVVEEGGGWYRARVDDLPAGRIVLRVVLESLADMPALTDSVIVYTRPPVLADGGALPADPTVPEVALPPRWTTTGNVWTRAGVRGGLAEGALRGYRPLNRQGDSLRIGPLENALDRRMSGEVGTQLQMSRGDLTLRFRALADAASSRWEPTGHRFGAELRWGPWVGLEVGDHHPDWAPLVLDGARVRGVGIQVAAASRTVNWARLRLMTGELRREVDAHVRLWTDGTTDTVAGSWARDVTAMQLVLGNAQRVLWQVTALRVADDTTSLDRATQDSLKGSAPRENLVFGHNLRVWSSGRRVEFYTQSAFSLTTDNARLGSIPDSVQEQENLNLPGFLGSLVTINSTTRGTERLLGGEETSQADWATFVGDNLAARSGFRWRHDGQDAVLRSEVRWIWQGKHHESMARRFRERARHGFELEQNVGILGGRLWWSGVAGWFRVPDATDERHSELDLFTSLALTPSIGGPGFTLQAGQRSAARGSADAWYNTNASLQAMQTRRLDGGSVLSTTGSYGIVLSHTEMGVAPTSTTQHAVDFGVSLRSPNGRWTPRMTGQVVADDLGRGTDLRVMGGLSAQPWSQRLQLGLDAGALVAEGGDDPGLRHWEQSSRITWTPEGIWRVDASQRLLVTDERIDIRVNAGAEVAF